METYELNIEENEYLYQEELLRLFEYELFEQQSDQIENFMNCLNNYLKGGTPPKHALKFLQFVESPSKGMNIIISFGLEKVF